jgi:hypothetical protein
VDSSFLSDDNFNLLMRQHGWSSGTFTYEPVEGNPEVIGQIWDSDELPSPVGSAPDSFFTQFGDTTFRKLLRLLFDKRHCTYDTLKKICGNEHILAQHLTYMVTKKIAEQDENTWRVSSRYAHIHDIGKTLEWYIAEWFHLHLHVPARYSVKLKGMPKGGDLDVVVFVGEKRVLIECKSRRIENIDDEELHLFLQRAAYFHPAIALLLVDTDSSVDTLSERTKRIYATSELVGPENTQGIQWNTGCIEIATTPRGRRGIDNALQAIFDISRRDHDKPLVELSPLDMQKIKGVLPGLNKVDTQVMKLLCEKAIATESTAIDTEDIREETQELNISHEGLNDAIEMLMKMKYTNGKRYSNGSYSSVLNELTISGFDAYARTFRDGYVPTIRAVASLIVNTTPTPNSYELATSLAQPLLIIYLILMFFESKELLKSYTTMSKVTTIFYISPELKRAVREGKEL